MRKLYLAFYLLFALSACTTKPESVHRVSAQQCGVYRFEFEGFQKKHTVNGPKYFAQFTIANFSDTDMSIYTTGDSELPEVHPEYSDFQINLLHSAGWESDVTAVGGFFAPTDSIKLGPGKHWQFYYLVDGYRNEPGAADFPRRVVVTSKSTCKYYSSIFYLKGFK